jgi:hypothetical protein
VKTRRSKSAEAVPAERAIEVRHAAAWLGLALHPEENLVRCAAAVTRVRAVAVVELLEVHAVTIDLATADEEPQMGKDRVFESAKQALDAAIVPLLQGCRGLVCA